MNDVHQYGEKSVYIEQNTGTVTIHSSNTSPKTPQLLTSHPFNTDFFIGRDADMQVIEAEYQNHNRLLMLVNGEGGMGKTTLAAKYWYAHQYRYQHLAWLYANNGIGAALLTLAKPLGVVFEPTDNEATQTERVSQKINHLARPTLLVFDNANDANDLDKHYVRLKKLPNCHILLTSRVTKWQDVAVHAVKPLSKTDAIRLFEKHYPQHQDTEALLLHSILEAVGYNTLVIELLAKNLMVWNKYQTQYSLENLLQDLQAKGVLALKNKQVKVVYGSDTLRTETPENIIEAMYDLATLTETEQHLLSNLAVLPAENIPYETLQELLKNDIDTPLSSLEEKGWIEYRPTDGSFKISPVVQAIVLRKNTDVLVHCRRLIYELIQSMSRDALDYGHYDKASRYAHLAETVVKILNKINSFLAILCQNLGHFHETTGNLDKAMQAYTQMTKIQQDLCEVEPNNGDFTNGLASAYSNLGDTFKLLGSFYTALVCFEKSNKLVRKLHNNFPSNIVFKNDLAISCQNLGNIHSSLNSLEEALRFFEEFNKLMKKLYCNDPSNVGFKDGLAISYERLGDILSSLGHFEAALGFFEEYNLLEKQLYEAYPSNVGFKNGLAVSYSKLGQFSNDRGNAKSYFKQAENLWLELVRDAPQYAQYKQFLKIVQNEIARL